MQRLTVIHGGTNYFSCRLNAFSLSLFNDSVASMVRDAQSAPHRSIARDGYIVEVDEVDTDGIDADTEDMCDGDYGGDATEPVRVTIEVEGGGIVDCSASQPVDVVIIDQDFDEPVITVYAAGRTEATFRHGGFVPGAG